MSAKRIDGDLYVAKHCATCGVKHYVPKVFDDECRRQGPKKGWTCPNGHSWVYSKSMAQQDAEAQELSRLRQRIAERDDKILTHERLLRHERQLKDTARRSARAYKGQATKLKNRAKAGVCPCCNRTFANLKRHMDGQHPNYALPKTEKDA